MTCRRFVEYSESDISVSFATHLEACAECAAQVEKTKLLENEVAAMAGEADDNMPEWRADVRHVDHLKSEREVAIEALRQTFRRLRKPEPRQRNAHTRH